MRDTHQFITILLNLFLLAVLILPFLFKRVFHISAYFS